MGWADKKNFEKINKTTPKVMDTELSNVLYGVVDKDNRISEMVIDLNGQVPMWVLSAWRSRMDNDNTSVINFWGDSLTAGAGGNGTTYPAIVGYLSGRTVKNFGVGGETSATIAARQGGRSGIVKGFTIPADNATKVKIADATNEIKDELGNNVRPIRQGTTGVNPCYIAGVKGTLTITQTSSTASDYEYFFQRETAGIAVDVNRPTPIITNAQMNDRSGILVIFIGQNGGWADNAELISQVKGMIEFNKDSNKRYIVLGLTSLTESSRAQLEKDFTLAFGRRYINLRKYLVDYGLQDAGITPTTQDTTDISTGTVPTSLRSDGVHFNDKGYTVIGNVVYKRMKELEMI